MRIKPMVYQQLTPPQRLIAVFEALGRNDDNEVRQLFQTCPRKLYSSSDPVFTDRYQLILDRALSIEYELLQLTLQFILSSQCDDGREQEFLDKMGELNREWSVYLKENGISQKSIFSILPRNPIVTSLIEDLYDHKSH